MTQTYAGTLAYIFSGRQSTTELRSTRSSNTDVVHEPSGHKWYDVASRYVMQYWFPTRAADFWAVISSNGSTAYDREKDDDIVARGIYAKEIGADALISLHSNAEDTGAVRGTRVYYTPNYPNSPESLKLATSILCGMKEVIHAQAAYKDFLVSDAPHPGVYGENWRAGTVPAVIIETAFHSNAADAAALKDLEFRNASMKGVEKGYRIYKQGKVCTPFKITSIPNVTAQRGGPAVTVKLNYAGFPEFPVTRETKYITCPSGHTCTNTNQTYTAVTPSPLTYAVTCSGTSTTTDVSKWSVTLTDVDGVKTVPVEYTLTCTPSAAAKASGTNAAVGTAIGDDRAN